MRKDITKQLLGMKKDNQKKLQKFEELKAACDHKEVKKGKLKTSLHPIDDSGEKFKCELCGSIVDLEDIDINSLTEAVETILKALEAIKAIGEFEEFDKVLMQIAQSKLLLERLPEVYKNLVIKQKRKETEYSGQANSNDIFANNMYNGNAQFGGNPLFRNGNHDKKNKDYKHKNKKKHNNNRYDSPFYR